MHNGMYKKTKSSASKGASYRLALACEVKKSIICFSVMLAKRVKKT